MSKTALREALVQLDTARVQEILERQPELARHRVDDRFDLLQFCAGRPTHGDPPKARRQLRLARWLVERGFDPLVEHETEPGEDGEEEPARLSLVWFAVAKARNPALARYFLGLGAGPGALFAAAWWGDVEIVPDLVERGADPDERVGGTPLHMAVGVLRRGVDGDPALAGRRRKLLRELLRLGADPNTPDEQGATPLHLALSREYLDALELLLEHGADPDLPGPDGRTVREIAARKRKKEFHRAMERLSPAAAAATGRR